MAIASLSALATDIVLHIFKSLDSHRTIVSLNSTSTRFYDIWRLNTLSISNAVLPRSIDCFEEAQELLKVQSSSIIKDADQSPYQVSLQHNRRLLSNASVVAKVKSGLGLLSKNEWLIERYGQQGPARLYYCLWTATALSDNTERQHAYMDTLQLRDLLGILLMVTGLIDAQNHTDDGFALTDDFAATIYNMRLQYGKGIRTAPPEKLREVTKTVVAR